MFLCKLCEYLFVLTFYTHTQIQCMYVCMRMCVYTSIHMHAQRCVCMCVYVYV